MKLVILGIMYVLSGGIGVAQDEHYVNLPNNQSYYIEKKAW